MDPLSAFTYIVSPHITLWQSEEFLSFRRRLDDFFEGQVHVGVAVDQVAIKSFAGFELDEHRVALRRGEEAEGELLEERRVVSLDPELTWVGQRDGMEKRGDGDLPCSRRRQWYCCAGKGMLPHVMVSWMFW